MARKSAAAVAEKPSTSDNVIPMPGARDPNLEAVIRKVRAIKSEIASKSRDVRTAINDACKAHGYDKKRLKAVIRFIEQGDSLEEPQEFYKGVNDMLKSAGYHQLVLWE